MTWAPIIVGVVLLLGAVDQAEGGCVWWTRTPAAPAPSQTPAATPPRKPIQQPIPLFPKHRRGLYKNGQGLEVMDPTPQSPPLVIDDPSVPDKHAYEINFTTSADVSSGEKALDLLLIDANYGVEPRLFGHFVPTQLKFECPIAAIGERAGSFTSGVGPATAGLKFNVFESERTGYSVSVYPQLSFLLPGSDAVTKGLAESGQTLILPVLGSKELKYVTLVANAAVHVPIHDATRSVMGLLGVGVGVPIRRKLAVMAEVSSEFAVDFRHDRLVLINGGVMRAIGRSVIVYGNVGHSLFSDDGSPHVYVGAGLKIIAPRW